MSVSLSTPVTGSAQTGFTSPTYTVAVDTPPDVNSKQWVVTALGGTQTGVTSNTPSDPFTITFKRPKSLKTVPPVGTNGVLIRRAPKNEWRMIVRKGSRPAANQAYDINLIDVRIPVVSGGETYDSAEVRAMLSLAIGALSQISAGLGDSLVTGVL